jgi:RNA 2',3'-cyclic 3'-phosphodiesterase
MSELIRCFVAVDISEGARSQVARLIDGFRRQPAAVVRWVRSDLAHLTLAFLGEVQPSFIEAAKPELAQAAAAARSFSSRLAGVGAFPNPRRARVVWLGMEESQAELVALQRETVKALVRVGFVPEARPFSPHLTIGRLREPADVSAMTRARFESEQFAIDRLILFRSVLRSEGPTYDELASFGLGPAA